MPCNCSSLQFANAGLQHGCSSRQRPSTGTFVCFCNQQWQGAARSWRHNKPETMKLKKKTYLCNFYACINIISHVIRPWNFRDLPTCAEKVARHGRNWWRLGLLQRSDMVSASLHMAAVPWSPSGLTQQRSQRDHRFLLRFLHRFLTDLTDARIMSVEFSRYIISSSHLERILSPWYGNFLIQVSFSSVVFSTFPVTQRAPLYIASETWQPLLLASRGVAAHTAGLFRSVRGAKGGFPLWGLPKLRIFTSPPRGGSPS